MARAVTLTLQQAWAVIDQARADMLPRPVSVTQLARLREAIAKRHGESLPAEIVESLGIHNGGPSIESYKLLAARDIPRWTERIPFPDHLAVAVDGGGNLLALNDRGKLVGIERGQGLYLGKFKKAASIAAWLSSVARDLERGKLVVVGGNIEEKVAKPSVVPEPVSGQRLEHPFADEVRAAIASGDVETLTAMLADGRITAQARDWTETFLIAQAATAGQLAVVKLLMGHGCPVDWGAAQGARTALFCSCWGGSPKREIFDFVIEQGADPNAQTCFDGTPLHSAVMWGHLDLAQALVAAGGDPLRCDAQGRSAIDWVGKLPESRRQGMLAALGAKVQVKQAKRAKPWGDPSSPTYAT